MKKLIYFLVNLLVGYVLFGCQPSETSDSTDTPYLVDAGISGTIDSLISPRDLLTQVEYIVLGSPEEFFLTQAQKILELDGKIFILDKNRRVIIAYDLQGNFIGQVGKRGKGPEEYQSAYDFEVDPERNVILILSTADQAILEFNSDLSFRRKFRINIFAYRMSLLESGNIAFDTYIDEGGSNIAIFNLEGQQVDSRMPFPENGEYIAADYTGFLIGDYYTYPLSSIIYRLNEKEDYDSEIFEIDFPQKRSEDMKFEHVQYFMIRGSKKNILGKFCIGKDASELLFKYGYIEGGGSTLGVKLASGQVFGHLNMKHGFKEHSDPFDKLFFGFYSFPSYSSASGNYYVATNNEYMEEFYSNDIEASLNKIRRIDSTLSQVLEESKNLANPILMRFKLKKEI